MSDSTNDPRSKRWAKALNSKARIQVSSIEIIKSNIFAPQTIEFDRLTAVVGYHGSGKTLLLRLIEAVFGWSTDAGSPPFIRDDIANRVEAEVIATVLIDGRQVTRRVDLASSEKEREALWNEAGDAPLYASYSAATVMLHQLLIVFQSYDYYADRHRQSTDEHIHRRYNRDDLAALRNILGRDYREVTVHALPDNVGKEPDYDPYFVATLASPPHQIVTGATMSLGELWAHWLLGWKMGFDSSQQVARLVDEPESFLTLRGHRALADEMVRRSLADKTQLIVATHSLNILRRFPLSNIRLCVNQGGAIVVQPPQNAGQLRASIGLSHSIRVVVLVEDDVVQRLLTLFCGRFDPSLIREIDVVIAGGHSEIIPALKTMKRSRHIRHFGVLDGDARSAPKVGEVADSVGFLPGTRGPEAELAAVVERSTTRLADALSLTEWSVRSAMSICSDLDHQYWIAQFADQLGRATDVLLNELVGAWLDDPSVAREAAELVAQVRRVTDLP